MTSDKHPEPVIDCDTIGALIPDYAFGLTDADESRLVESGLLYCADAATQLAEFRRLQDEMRESVAEREPPPHLGERLMAAIVQPDVPVVENVQKAEKASPPPPVVQPKMLIRPAWMAAAAAVLVLVVTNFYWFTRVNDLTTRYNALETHISGQKDTSFVLTSTDNLRWVRLSAAEESTGAAAFMMWNADSKIGMLYAASFPTLQEGVVYELWLTRGEERISAGTFTVDHYGKGALLFNVSVPIDEFTWARVTAEPAGDSPQPGSTVITAGEL